MESEIMAETEFKAIVLSNEINLNKISQHFGSNRKLKWEEYLILKGTELQGIVREIEMKRVYLFHFGSIVFLNFQYHEIMDVINYLKTIENGISRVLDEIEEVVNNLYRGELTVSDEKLAKMSASILEFKLSTISYVMLLDKPAITWNNEEASELFDELTIVFELTDRYEKLRHKIDTLMDIIEVFSGLAHSKRGTRLEWAVIILIGIEICLSLFALFFEK